MKKFAACVCMICMMCGVCVLPGCSHSVTKETKHQTVTVSTFDEMKALHSTGAGGLPRVVLANDIDIEFETITGIRCHSFDGQGHTISNAVIRGGGFFANDGKYGMEYIKNITFDGITLNTEQKEKAGIVLDAVKEYSIKENKLIGTNYGYGTIFENVHVRNSSITSEWKGSTNNVAKIGGILGASEKSKRAGTTSFTEINGSDAVLKNCTAENVTIETPGNVCAGGLVGFCETVSLDGCRVSACEISAKSTAIYQTPRVGGLIGVWQNCADSVGDEHTYMIQNSCVTDNLITASAEQSERKSLGFYDTGTVYVGGAIGESTFAGAIEYCHATNNKLFAKSSGNVYAGGLIGNMENATVQQCYTDTDAITANSCLDTNKERVERVVGGLIGRVKKAAVFSCFSVNNTIQDSGRPSENSAVKSAGLIASANTLEIRQSAVYNNTVDSRLTDTFCADTINIDECYITEDVAGNRNGCSILDEIIWYSDSIRNTLRLVGPNWQFSPEKTPCLVF